MQASEPDKDPVSAGTPILSVEDLHTRFDTRDGTIYAVNGVSLDLAAGETLGIVGESGCGKSVLSLSIMGLLPHPPARIASGRIRLAGQDLVDLDSAAMRRIRGNDIAMIFQEPMTSLNPVFTVGYQMAEPLKLHQGFSRKGALEKAREFLEQVRIPDAGDCLKAYPHELSGGMRQRVMIAMALCCNPEVLIADEPTTALDVTVQAQILTLMRELKTHLRTAIMMITHDLSVVAEVADSVVVMYAGQVVEKTSVTELFEHPTHPYTLGLLKSRPDFRALPVSQAPITGLPRFRGWCPRYARKLSGVHSHRVVVSRPFNANRKRRLLNNVPQGTGSPAGKRTKWRGVMADRSAVQKTPANQDGTEPLLEVQNLRKYYTGGHAFFASNRIPVRAVDGVSFSIKRGETLSLVGESGCGKTTVGRSILRLQEPTDGVISLLGQNISHLPEKQLRPFRRHMQMIFQDPYLSLSPKLSVRQIVSEPLQNYDIVAKADRYKRVSELLERVGLSKADFEKRPHEFSGGQRQRLGIARAIALNPSLLIADEAVSALDVSVQAQVINLMMDLQEEYGLSYLFIAHDLAVVAHISHRVAVMYLGEIVELGDCSSVFSTPLHPYTESLMGAVPSPDPAARDERHLLEGDVPSPKHPPAGCRFHTRCPYAMRICGIEPPPMREVSPGHHAACHLHSSDPDGNVQNSDLRSEVSDQSWLEGAARSSVKDSTDTSNDVA